MSKTGKTAPSWERKEDEDWAASVEVRLVLDHDAPGGLADEVLAEAHEIVGDAGLPAREVLGEPEAYARTVAAERISERHRARVDTRGVLPGERVTATLGTLGFVGFGLCVLHWIEDGLWMDWSGASVAGCATAVAVAALVCFAFVARVAGRIRGMWGFLAGAVAALGGGAAVAATVPAERLFSVPAPVLALVCAGWTVGSFALPDATVDRWCTPARPADGIDDERWLDRLEGLLRGRHAMRGAEARGHVREARQHLAAAQGGGERAEDVFGDVEVYALRLADGPRKRQRVARRKAYGSAALALVVGVLVVDQLFDPEERASGWMICWVVMLGCLVWNAIDEWRGLRALERGREA
ncbi:hypothetical protein ACIBKX_32140 [Streptomyces sp. NPDC050658]|uniref:hypothetical protein n=1 Tax=unclassified Streptomyces TaxID=2593676 RepID=UPI003433C44A